MIATTQCNHTLHLLDANGKPQGSKELRDGDLIDVIERRCCQFYRLRLY
jgi:hypothetical protein